ncbi:hypothetical protein POTOM_020284 [Populus tomentosa]|uniref:SWIM-type domain-containing protein n=1 Tax=Populus tomentosa TaxID=118781 RepID=A0A8X8D0D7_POPTO|nr:hypothetical protein POTOM_020284 [Populus tomentosa]
MAEIKIIAICQLGGDFETDKDGTLSYTGGDAHAIDIDDKIKFNDFKLEVAEMFSCNVNTMSLKYFLPGNKKTLITISNDKDLNRMIKFHGDSFTVDIYVILEDNFLPGVSNLPASKSSRTTLSEEEPPIDAPLAVLEDITQPDNSLSAPLDLDVIDDTNNADVHIEDPQIDPLEISPILRLLASNDEKHAKGAQQWQNTITGVGQRFRSVHEFRESLRKYAIAHQFAFRYKKNDGHRVTVKCKAEGCPWRIHASRLSTTQLICIKKMNPTHTCEGSVVTTGHQATRSWVASIIKEKLKVFPNYKPKDIVNDIKQEYGIQLNYFQAWRGKEIAKEQLQGSYKEAYNQLPFFCDKIMETNPGSLATFTTKDDSSFEGLFVSFHASLYGFVQGCRPLLFLDSLPLNSKYQGTLFAATAADGNDSVFPVAFAVVDAESNDNWHWFLLQLKTALSTSCPITFVADKQRGLKESIAEIFKGARYNYMTSNFGEMFYTWVSDAHELPITQMVDVIRGKIMELIYKRQADSNQWLTRLTPSSEEKLEKENLKVRPLQVLLSAGSTFEVRGESVEVVDIDLWDCSCKEWQLAGFPCCHALAVIGCIGRCPYDYCSRYFTTESYRLTYSESVHPVTNVDMPVEKDSSQVVATVTPPPTRRPRGRPSTKKYGQKDVVKRQLQCSRCKGLGHNKSTCKELL